MGQLVSTTVNEFKQNPFKIMDICAEVCVAANADCIVIVPGEKKGIYQEIARVERAGRGIRYVYNVELMRKFGINVDPKRARIEKILVDAFNSVGFFSGTVRPDTLKSKFQRAVDLAYEELTKLMR